MHIGITMQGLQIVQAYIPKSSTKGGCYEPYWLLVATLPTQGTTKYGHNQPWSVAPLGVEPTQVVGGEQT